MILYPDQVRWVAGIRAAMAGGARSVVAQAQTGFGKTAAISTVIQSAVAKGKSVVFAAHLDAILDDTAGRLRALDIRCGIIQADRRDGRDLDASVQVCSTGTLHARPTLRPLADLLIVDEAHRALSPSLRAIIGAYPDARIILMTATPQRGDGQAMGDVADALVLGPSSEELIAAGRLVRAVIHAPKAAQEGALGMAPLSAYERWCRGRPCIAFAVHAAHAKATAAALTAAGYPTSCVLDETNRKQRVAARAGLADGSLAAVVTVRALLEGFDAPNVSSIMLCQAFGTVSAYLQALGRGLRCYPGKTDCVVVDLRGAWETHGLPEDRRTWTLEGSGCVEDDPLPRLRRCSQCQAVFITAVRCPRCGSVNLIDPRPVRVKQAEFMEASGIPLDRRAKGYIDKVVASMTRSGKLPESVARRIALKGAPQWVRDGLAMAQGSTSA